MFELERHLFPSFFHTRWQQGPSGLLSKILEKKQQILVVIFPTNVWKYDVLDFFPFENISKIWYLIFALDCVRTKQENKVFLFNSIAPGGYAALFITTFDFHLRKFAPAFFLQQINHDRLN